MLKGTIVVTGGVGFIGTNLVKQLNTLGYKDIIIVDHLNTNFKKKHLSQLTYKSYLEKDVFRKRLRLGDLPDISCVIHLGACSNTREYNTKYLLDNNLEYSKELFQFCVEHNCRFIYASSASVYGDGKNGYNETSENLSPLNPYAESKLLFDSWLIEQKKRPIQTVGLRFFNVYGPYEEHKESMASVIFHAYHQIKKSHNVKLFKSYKKEWKNGEQARDFIYVRDVVNIIIFFMNNQKINGIFNVGTGKARTFLDLAKATFLALGGKATIQYIDMPEAMRSKYQYFTQAKTDKLKNIGYTLPFTSLEEGIKDYVQNFLEK